jgi:hypothetical protein
MVVVKKTSKKKKKNKADSLLKRVGEEAEFERDIRVMQSLKDDSDRVHCTLCRTSFKAVRDTLLDHIKGKKHQSFAVRAAPEKVESGSKQQSLLPGFFGAEAEEEKLQAKHRRRVTRVFLEKGISLEKITGELKDLLEEARPQGISLGHHSNL